jgi:hypothetical protein
LPVDFLTRQSVLRERVRADEHTLGSYREVFVTGVCAYQQCAYLELVQWSYGRAVARQVEVHQRRLLEFTTGRGEGIRRALRLIEGALETRTVSASTREGEISIPIEMNVALALLLGLPESPDYASTSALRAEQITRMQPEIDWRLAHFLACAREEIRTVFLPVFTSLEDCATGGTAAGRCE